MVEPARERHYTYADVLTWPEGERWELFDGVPYAMSPAPGTQHQLLSVALERQLLAGLEGSPCLMVHAPFDVRLPEQGESADTASTVVQPDIAVICQRELLDAHGYVGAPTLVVEILSPGSARLDLQEKRDIYERAGVREYWVVHPAEKAVSVYLLGEDGRYGAPLVYTAELPLPATAIPGITIDLARVFAEV
jgi:Uma2 family endonuclease